LTPEQLNERLKFYQWGERFGTSVGNLELVSYCCFQQALIFDRQNFVQDAENKKQKVKDIGQLLQ